MFRLVIARASPFARKARIFLLEKALPFETVVDNPWMPDTGVAAANPLGKVPVLFSPDGRVVHDSKVIVEYLETIEGAARLLPLDPIARFEHRQVEAIADGICDALVLIVLEQARPHELRSDDWIDRQQAKIESGLEALDDALRDRTWFVDDRYGLADIAAGCALGYLDLRRPEFDWRDGHPRLAALADRLGKRRAFAATIPAIQPIPAPR